MHNGELFSHAFQIQTHFGGEALLPEQFVAATEQVKRARRNREWQAEGESGECTCWREQYVRFGCP
jgi:hypothetical protein